MYQVRKILQLILEEPLRNPIRESREKDKRHQDIIVNRETNKQKKYKMYIMNNLNQLLPSATAWFFAACILVNVGVKVT